MAEFKYFTASFGLIDRNTGIEIGDFTVEFRLGNKRCGEYWQQIRAEKLAKSYAFDKGLSTLVARFGYVGVTAKQFKELQQLDLINLDRANIYDVKQKWISEIDPETGLAIG